ncbi:hypothetical protein DFH28DRAFT_1135288 [Melampsora americana]|nr:hypothetical protein DFH28DRAFT_1135288 [Melampsora americana]
MQETMKIEEEKKKMLALKLREQAEERERRAELRESGPTDTLSGLEIGENTIPPDPTLTQHTLPIEVQSNTQPIEEGDNRDHVRENNDGGGHVVVDLCEVDEEKSESSGIEEGGKKKKKGKISLGTKKKKAKGRKGKGRKSKSPSPMGEGSIGNGKTLYGGLIEADQPGLGDERICPAPHELQIPSAQIESSNPIEDPKNVNRAKNSGSLIDRLTQAIDNTDVGLIALLRNEMVEEEKLRALKQEVKELERNANKSNVKKKKKCGKKVKKQRMKSKKKGGKKRRSSPSSSSSDSSSSASDSLSSSSSDSDDSDSSSSSDLENSSSESEEEGKTKSKANVEFEFKSLQGLDLPDLPEHWDKAYKKLKRYVPLSVFKRSYIDAYHSTVDEGSKKRKKNFDLQYSERDLERQMNYGEFIRACDLEARYAKEIYGHDAYAIYIKKHKELVNDLMDRHKCWMIALRYHLAIRALIFRKRSRIMYKIKKNGKEGRKVEKVVLPEGVQEEAVQRARWDAESAGDLMYEENPYAPGQPKFGHDFLTGQLVDKMPPTQSTSKPQLDYWSKGKDNGGNQYRKKRGGNRGHYYGGGFQQQQKPYFRQQSYGGFAAPVQAQTYTPFVPQYPHNGFTSNNTYANYGGQDWVNQGQGHANKQTERSLTCGMLVVTNAFNPKIIICGRL